MYVSLLRQRGRGGGRLCLSAQQQCMLAVSFNGRGGWEGGEGHSAIAHFNQRAYACLLYLSIGGGGDIFLITHIEGQT